MNPLELYRSVPCQMRWRFWLSVVAVAYSTAAVVVQASDGSTPAGRAGWESPAVVLALVSILVSVGAFIQTVKSAVDAVAAEKRTREEAMAAERRTREAFEHQAHEQFARRDVIAAELTSIRHEIAMLRTAVLGERA